jgi:hypothetical protein
LKAVFSLIGSPLGQAQNGFRIMASKKVLQRMERWLAKAGSHSLAKREADLALLLANDPGAWKRYSQFYGGWTLEEIAELLEAVRAAV